MAVSFARPRRGLYIVIGPVGEAATTPKRKDEPWHLTFWTTSYLFNNMCDSKEHTTCAGSLPLK